MPKHIAVYMRVSTRRQDTRSQEPDLRRWVEAYADGQPVVWCKDKYSGRTTDRPGWQRLEDDLTAGRVSRIVCWRLDRLGRSAASLTRLFDDLRKRNVGLVSLKEGVDLATASGRLLCRVMASVAEFESELKSERILAGQQAARDAGKRWGGSQPGVRKKVTDDQLRIARQMKLDGTPITRIAKALGLSRPTIYSVLDQE